MTDVDRMVRGSLERHAEQAPTGERLLAAVHARSGRLRRRRRTWATATTVAVVGVLAAAVPVAIRTGGPAQRVAGPSPAVSATGDTGTGPTTPAATTPDPAGTATSAPDPAAIRLAVPTYAVPTLALRLGVAASDWKAPVVSLDGGALQAYFEAKDPVGGADVTLVVTERRPTFGAAAGPVRETDRQVRGRTGRLRTVAISPAAEITVYWQEAPTQWVQLRTDDTFTEAQVVRFADGLTATAVPVDAGLRLDLAPAGWLLDTASPSALALRPADVPAGAPASSKITCTLVRPRPLTGTTVAVGAYRGALTRAGTGATLAVDVDDRGVTLLVQVPTRYAISDADLIRFAAGVRLTDRAESTS